MQASRGKLGQDAVLPLPRDRLRRDTVTPLAQAVARMLEQYGFQADIA